MFPCINKIKINKSAGGGGGGGVTTTLSTSSAHKPKATPLDSLFFIPSTFAMTPRHMGLANAGWL